MVDSLTRTETRRLRRDGAALAQQSHALLDRLNLVEQQVLLANAEAIRLRVIRALANIGVDRLAPVIGRRHGRLAEHGYRTLADLYGVFPAQLTAIRGIGPKTANATVMAVRAAFDDIASTTNAQITGDPGDTTSQELIAALLAYQHAQQSIGPIADDLATVARDVPDALADTKWAGWGFLQGLLGKRRRAQSDQAIGLLQRWTHWAANPQIQQRIEIGLSTRSQPALSPSDLIAAYERDPMGLYRTLEDVLPEATASLEQQYLPSDLAGRIEAIELSEDLLTASLRRYQVFGAKYIVGQERVLIGDEMGLGKTIQALAAAAHLHRQSATHTLVVCPAAVLINWIRETGKHTKLPVQEIYGTDRLAELDRWLADGGVAVTTFDGLKPLTGETRIAPDLLIVDEAHYAKNPDAQRTQAVAWAAARARRVAFLTGTPMQNRLEEFRSLIGLLQPAAAEQLRVTAAGTNSVAFRRAAAPVYLRRNLEEVASELPDVIEVDEWEELTEADAVVYRNAVGSGNFMAMRRAAFLDPGSAKLDRLREIVAESVSSGRRVIVFSFFLDVLNRVQNALPTRMFGPITGAVSSAQRQAMVDDFSGSPEPGVLLAQITAGGEGLNIQAASVVILCEPQIKPSMEQQAIGRVRRLGQTRTVQVHRLLAADTVDQRMLELLGQKQHLFDTYIRDSVLAEQSEQSAPMAAELGRQIVAAEQDRLGLTAPVDFTS